MKNSLIVLILLVAIMMSAGCRGGNGDYEDAFVGVDPPQTQEPEQDTEAETDPEEYEEEYEEEIWVDPRPRALLTGMPIDEAYLNRRPVAAVINNIHIALPQSGIAQADVIYEVLSEGNITRLIGIFQSDIPEKIGPVRSTRDYFVDFAFNHDAIFIHHGGSATGYARIRNTGIPNLDGMALEGTVFWRDRSYPEWHAHTGLRPTEHSSYTGWEQLSSHITSRGIRSTINDNPAFGFNFVDCLEDIPAASSAGHGSANRIYVSFSPTYGRTFVFDHETGLYMVENSSGPLQDAETEAQVAVANVLVQLTTKRVIDNEGRRYVGTVGEGTGYLATGGRVYRVRWAKASHTAPMRWYFEDGTPLALTPGQTWINVFQSNGVVTFE